MSENKEQVTIVSKLPNGLRLHVMKRKANAHRDPFEAVPMFEDMGFVDIAGFRPASATAPGEPHKTESHTVMDKELWDIWYAENKANPMVTGGMLSVYEPPKLDEPQPEHKDEHEHEAANEHHEEPRGDPVKHGDSPHEEIPHEEPPKPVRYDPETGKPVE